MDRQGQEITEGRAPVNRARSAIAAAAALATLGVAACGGPGSETVKGGLVIDESILSASQDYPDITDGTQVVVVNSAGDVVGTADLRFDAKDTVSASALISQTAYDFTVTVPSGLPRYGIRITTHGTVWFTPSQMSKGPVLSLAGSSPIY